MVPREVRYSQEYCCWINPDCFVLRYRSTATLIASVLAFGPYSPHKTLNKFVELSTNFRPTDGEKWCADEADINFNNKTARAPTQNFSRLGV